MGGGVRGGGGPQVPFQVWHFARGITAVTVDVQGILVLF